MKRVKELILFLRSKMNKYWIAVIVGVFFTFIIGENNIYNRISHRRQIRRLQNEINYYTRQKEANLQKLKELHSDNESLEKLAREEYHMVKPDEELFIIRAKE